MTVGAADRLRSALGPDAGFVPLHVILSRFVYLGVGVATALLSQVAALPADQPTVWLHQLVGPAGEAVGGLLVQGDSAWYQRVVQDWYEAIPFEATEQHDWAFFPLFPSIVRALGSSTAAGILVANACLILANLLLVREVATFAGRIGARWTVLFVLYWPMSGMLSSFRPEALLLLLLVCVWMAGRRQRWWLAWTLVALATLTRPQGVFSALLLLEPMWAARHVLVRRPWLLLGAMLPVIAIGVFSWHLGTLTGDPLAWIHIQAAWGRPGFDPAYFLDAYWPFPFVRYVWDFSLLNAAFLVVAIVAAVAHLTRRHPGLALFTAAWALSPVIAVSNLIAMGRWLSVVFTIPLAMATHPRLRRARLPMLITSVALLAGVAAWISLDYRAVMP